MTDLPEPAVKEQEVWHELVPLLDQELSRLPDKYRIAIVLCDLEGKTRKAAARQLGLPEGTVASRLTRARAMLAKQLARHGLPVSGGALAVALSHKAAAAGISTFLVSSTIKAATLLAAGQAVTGLTSAEVAALTEGVIKAMLLNKLKKVTMVLLLMLFGIGSGLLIVKAFADDENPQAGDEKKSQPAAVTAPEKEVVQTTAAAVVDAYRDNDAAGDEKFTDRHVEIAGKFIEVRRVELDRGGGFGRHKVYVLSFANYRGTLWFQFDLKDQKRLAALKSNQDVTIRGQCKGRIAIVANGKPDEAILFSDCEIVDAKPSADKGTEKKNGFEQKP